MGTSGGSIPSTVLPTTGTYTILVDPVGTNTGSATVALQSLPPAPTLLLTYVGKLRDRVGGANTSYAADGTLDGVLQVTVQSVHGVGRTLTQLELKRSDGYGVYDTASGTAYWALGVANTLDAALLNDGTGAVSFAVTDAQVFHLFASEATPSPFIPGVTFIVTAWFSDGSISTASTVVSNAPTLSLVYSGLLRDRVGPSNSAFTGDGALDGTFQVTVQTTYGLNRTVTELELRRSDTYGIYDTVSGTSSWALGAASTLDGALLNGDAHQPDRDRGHGGHYRGRGPTAGTGSRPAAIPSSGKRQLPTTSLAIR